MSVTPAASLAGVLPVVISGGRPRLKQRPTSLLLPALHGVTADPVWVVRDDRAGEYERDGHEVVAFPKDAAEEYAAQHWIGEEPFTPGGFTGAFCEREWACRTAEERGCWAVLQLDDNLKWLKLLTGAIAGKRLATRYGGLGFFADILAAVTLATNSRMTGCMLDGTPTDEYVGVLARTGFPYSLFVEQVGPGREAYHGPGEDDIMHAYQYGRNPTEATAALVPPLRYAKEHASKTGMRQFYQTGKRTVGAQRAAPEMIKLHVRRTTSNGRGKPRIFHQMLRNAIRTPLVITDPALYQAAAAELAAIVPEMTAEYRKHVEAKVARRAARWNTPAR